MKSETTLLAEGENGRDVRKQRRMDESFEEWESEGLENCSRTARQLGRPTGGWWS